MLVTTEQASQTQGSAICMASWYKLEKGLPFWWQISLTMLEHMPLPAESKPSPIPPPIGYLCAVHNLYNSTCSSHGAVSC